MKGPSLDPLNSQTEWSEELLSVFRIILESPDYVERLARHYRMFRDAVEKRHDGPDRLEARRIENRRKRLRDPKRRGRRA